MTKKTGTFHHRREVHIGMNEKDVTAIVWAKPGYVNTDSTIIL